MSNSLGPNSFGPDQAELFIGPDLGPNCLRRVSADNTSRQSPFLCGVYHKCDFLL